MIIRSANAADAARIAALHARSWQENYRGSFSDEYLDKHAPAERLQFWNNRFANPAEEQWVIIAENDTSLLGFCCVLLNKDEEWGSLLDNLHVSSTKQGQGLGKQLMQLAAQHIATKANASCFHLYVLTNNTRAIRVYEKLGGIQQAQLTHREADGREQEIYRYVWQDLASLIAAN